MDTTPACTLPAANSAGAVSVDDAERAELVRGLAAIEAWGHERQWVGPDPYEGLNATRFVGPLKQTRLGRQLLVQAVKRSPLDLRPLLGVPPGLNAAALAWVTSSYALDGFLPEDLRMARLEECIQRLQRLRLNRFEEACWSYHWDLQTRVFFYPKTDPNTIATSFAAMAFLDAYERTGEPHLLEVAMSSGDFFLRRVPQTKAEGGAYFGYLVGDRSPIHNANLLACAVLARLARHGGPPRLKAAARAGVGFALAHQRPDGSWPYGEKPDLKWVDNFHTGYVLDSLMICHEAGIDDRIPSALERALDHYRRKLFLSDGTPKYFADSVYPIDAQSIAQGIQTLALASTYDPANADLAWKVYRYGRRRMRRADGTYFFQRRRFWKNPTTHVRWVMAPMMLGLTHLLRTTKPGATHANRPAGDP